MELNMIVVAMLIALIVYMLGNRFKMFMDHKKALEDVNHRGDFKKIFTGWWLVGIYSLAMVVSIFGGFMFYFNRAHYDNYVSWILVFVVIFVTSTTDIVKTAVLHTTYYNDQGIFHYMNFFKYNSVKNFKPKRIGISTEVFLYNGQSYLIPTKGLQFLEDRMVKAQKDK